jgi:SAM-dependent methyltransferase
VTAARPAGSAWSARADAYAVSEVHARGASLTRLLALAAPRTGEPAVDLGCGAGHTGAALAAAGCEVTAVDRDAAMLDAARRRYPALRTLRADAAATGLPPASFALATARHTLHHHDDPDATLREARRLLRPGGRFVLVDESALPPALDAWYDELERTRDPDHRALRDADGWRAALQAAGFADARADADTRERIEVAGWLERVAADAARRHAVRALLRAAPAGAAEALRFERDAAGEVVAFAMPMVVAHARVPEARASADPASAASDAAPQEVP